MNIRRIYFSEAGSPGLHILKYIFSPLSRLYFHYAALGIFGKAAVEKSLKAASFYLDGLDFPGHETPAFSGKVAAGSGKQI